MRKFFNLFLLLVISFLVTKEEFFSDEVYADVPAVIIDTNCSAITGDACN